MFATFKHPLMRNLEVERYDDADSDLSDEDREPEPALCSRMVKSSLWQDVCESVYDSRYASAVALVVALYVGYIITISPYQSSHPYLSPEQRSLDTLKYVRPVLTDEKIQDIYKNTFYAETTFEMPEPFYDTVKLRFHTEASKHGHFRPPSMFYEGVTYGLTWENSHDLTYFREDSSREALESAILAMDPAPSEVFFRSAHNNLTGWSESGIAVYFSNSHLSRQGMLSSDPAQPWKRTLDEILKVAIAFKLTYITQWYPHYFGAKGQDDPHLHAVILQQVIPTRTGLNGIKSTATVWLAAVNFTEPTVPPQIVRKEWSDVDHWTDYPVMK